ncbi:MAG: 4a-hydroxytetrahydrobiopterin dehydratase [Candidatus Parcubacteria bacterium]|jgi:4a-hydroxytetrahydrobiopterin dehydratase|nr:4a-hydroxytetrahydrobiopterin dehydratase [Candidatus Parcubacteria bacterium]
MVKLDEQAVAKNLKGLPDWERHDEVMKRLFEFEDFERALAFVNKVAEVAKKLDHHPDIDIRYNKVTLTLTTHSAGGLTEKDFLMAREINAL